MRGWFAATKRWPTPTSRPKAYSTGDSSLSHSDENFFEDENYFLAWTARSSRVANSRFDGSRASP